jgi:hypothetical protein
MSSAVMSRTVVKPATTEGASSSGTSFASRPITIASSASAVTLLDWSGSPISSPGPMIVVSGLMKLAGSSEGETSSRSSACSA